MAKKSKLDQILETYAEEEIRLMCAESTSRTDFAKRLGIDRQSQTKILSELMNILYLDFSHFIAARQRTPSQEEAQQACALAHSYKEMASLLKLKYRSDDSLYAGIYRIIRRYDLDNSHFHGVAKEKPISRSVPILSDDEIEQCRTTATSYQSLAELCGCMGNINQLRKQGEKIAKAYGLSKIDFAANRKKTYLQNTYATNLKISSWVWHHQHIKCSQCDSPIDNVAFLSTDLQQITIGEIKDFLICASCHKEIKQTTIDKFLMQLIPMSQENIEKCGVYLIRNIHNGLLYVGETRVNFKQRIDRHIRNATTGKPSQKLEEAILEYGERNFEFYILEIINKKQSQQFFFERESYWMDFLGSKNPLIGYNNYRSPSDHKNLTDKEILCFLNELKESSQGLYELSLKYGISCSAAGRIRLGQRRKQAGFDYPVYSKKEKDQFETLKHILALLGETELSFREISKQTGIASSALGKYNQGHLPQWALDMFGQDIDKYHFPLRECKRQLNVHVKSKYHEADVTIDTGRFSSKLKDTNPDEIFHKVLASSFKAVGKEFGMTDQGIRKFLKRRGYPTTLEEIITWLDEHPTIYSNKRIPLREELFETLNKHGKDGTAKYYGVSRQTIERWAKYRHIRINHATHRVIYLEDFHIEISTWKAVFDFLVENKICSPCSDSPDMIRHHVERSGCFCGIHMHYVEKPIAEYE